MATRRAKVISTDYQPAPCPTSDRPPAAHRLVRAPQVGRTLLALALVVAAAACEDAVPVPDFAPESALCATLSAGMFSSPTQHLPERTGRELFALGRWTGGGLARTDGSALLVVPLFLEEMIALTAPSGPTLHVATTGSLADATWGRCDGAGLMVVAKPARVGKGEIRLLDGDVVRWSTEVDVSEPAAVSVTLLDDENHELVEASVTDASGRPLYAGEVLWQLVPTIDMQYTKQGNQIELFGAIEQREVTITATFGDLVSSLPLVMDANHRWRVADD